jgi:hypothetical protein
VKAELEALLATAWTRETFATYADALQAEADPRGEWIALELAMLRDGVTPAIQQQRDKLMRRLKLEAFYASRFSFGFADDLRLVFHRDAAQSVAKVRAFFAGPIGGYVRRVELRAAPKHVIAMVEAMASGPRPWLYQLSLDAGEEFRSPAIPNELMRRLVAQCPRLESIELWHASALQMFGNLDAPAISLTQPGERRTPAFVRFAIPQRGHEDIEISRLERLHGGTVDEMPDPTREAWAELRWRIHRAATETRMRPPQPFPIPLLARIVREIDTSSYYGADWAGLERKLDRATEVSVEF